MKIKWNGHASFTITASDGTVLVTDPYDPSGYGGVLKYDQVRDRADGALVSHNHADHNYVKGLSGSPKIIKGDGQVREIKIKGISTHHDESGGSQRGNNVVFSFAVDGIKICFMGDIGHQLSQKHIEAIGPIDLLLLPVGGTYTVDADGAASVAKALGPRLIIPMHFKTTKCNLPIAGVDGFLSKMKGVKQLNRSEIDISAQNMPETQEVWVLDHAC